MSNREDKIVNLLQFARKAGKIVHGFDACLRSMNRKQVRLIVLATDLSDKSASKLTKAVEEMDHKIPVISLGTQEIFSQALGLPMTGIIGLMDKQFAVKILDYWTAEEKVEEPCSK